MTEVWLSVIGYGGWYEVSNLGHIKNVKKRVCASVGKVLNQRTVSAIVNSRIWST